MGIQLEKQQQDVAGCGMSLSSHNLYICSAQLPHSQPVPMACGCMKETFIEWNGDMGKDSLA